MCSFSYTPLPRDLDLDPMTLIYKFDLDILKMMYLLTKNEVSRSRLSKVRAQIGHTQTHTHTQREATERIITPYSRVVTVNE